MKKTWIIITCTLLLCGCLRSTPTNFYMLESLTAPRTVDRLPAKTLRIGQVQVAPYLNRNNIVSRVSDQTRLILAEFHLWAEPVSGGIKRVIGEILAQPMLDCGVNVLPAGIESGGDYVLLLDVQRLDGNFNEKAVLDCYWTLLDKNEKVIEQGIFFAEEQVNGADYNILVKAESSLMQDMGRYFAERLPELINKTPR